MSPKTCTANVLGARLITGDAQPIAPLNPQDTFRAATQESNEWSSAARSEQAFVQLLQDHSRTTGDYDRLERDHVALVAKHEHLVHIYDKSEQELKAALHRDGDWQPSQGRR